MPITQVRKRDGRLEPFDQAKIAESIFRAGETAGGADRGLADELAAAVTEFVNRNSRQGQSIPTIEEIQDMAERVLIETGHAKTAKAYILCRDERAKARRRMKSNVDGRSTLVDKAMIARTILGQGGQGLTEEEAMKLAKLVENRLIQLGYENIPAELIAGLAAAEMLNAPVQPAADDWRDSGSRC